MFLSTEVMVCLVETVYMLDKLCSGMNYSGVGREFAVNESTIDIK